MKKLIEETTFYDVAVCGGGFAGISAALAAAREGKKVVLFEKQYLLGGLGTAGLITIYLPLCDGCGRQVSFGIAEELLKLSITYGAEADYPENWLDGKGTRTEKDKRYMVQYNPHRCRALHIGKRNFMGRYACNSLLCRNRSGSRHRCGNDR